MERAFPYAAKFAKRLKGNDYAIYCVLFPLKVKSNLTGDVACDIVGVTGDQRCSMKHMVKRLSGNYKRAIEQFGIPCPLTFSAFAHAMEELKRSPRDYLEFCGGNCQDGHYLITDFKILKIPHDKLAKRIGAKDFFYQVRIWCKKLCFIQTLPPVMCRESNISVTPNTSAVTFLDVLQIEDHEDKDENEDENEDVYF